MAQQRTELRYKKLKNELIKIIKEQNLQPHDRFLSQPTVIKKYNVTITTVRRTFDDMERDGLIYRIHGKGTFIAPKSNTYTVLIVSNYPSQIREKHFSYMSFWSGIMDYLDQNEFNYYPTSISSKKFLAIKDELNLYYKNIKGVIFFRDCVSYTQSWEKLLEFNIPSIFYGSDYFRDSIQSNYLLYNEMNIVETAVNKILQLGYKNIGIYYNDNNPVRLRRYNCFLDIIENKQIENVSIISQKKVNKDKLKHILGELGGRTAFFCVDDWLAAELINCSTLAGKKIPNDIGIIGVNNHPFCPVLIEPLTSINIPVFEDAKVCFSFIIDNVETGVNNVYRDETDVEIFNRSSL